MSNLTLYDIKAGVRKVQNGALIFAAHESGISINVLVAVMNLTEMESMVREATNADPWGAPSMPKHETAEPASTDGVQAP